MGKKDKLIKKLKSNPHDYTFDEMATLLGLLSYQQSNKGKTSGSRVKFTNGQDVILMHKPHPGNELKTYQVKQLIEHLTQEGLI
ncbi:MAG: type II toxin-antitoxin system HicA family toxin [Lachnospiraceae bacterium]|nr:type II toxin-antitoxin system HicA family toxin [Lachnospiraceae bacterium]